MRIYHPQPISFLLKNTIANFTPLCLTIPLGQRRQAAPHKPSRGHAQRNSASVQAQHKVLAFLPPQRFCRQMWVYGQKTQSRSKYQNHLIQQWNGHWPAFWRNKAGNLERKGMVLWEVMGSPSWPVPASAFLPPNLIQDESCHTATPVPSSPQSVFVLWTKDGFEIFKEL